MIIYVSTDVIVVTLGLSTILAGWLIYVGSDR